MNAKHVMILVVMVLWNAFGNGKKNMKLELPLSLKAWESVVIGIVNVLL